MDDLSGHAISLSGVGTIVAPPILGAVGILVAHPTITIMVKQEGVMREISIENAERYARYVDLLLGGLTEPETEGLASDGRCQMPDFIDLEKYVNAPALLPVAVGRKKAA